MSPIVVADYVRVAAQAAEIPMSEDRIQRVAEHLGRTFQMAKLLDGYPLAADDELTQLFVPAPFPAPKQGR